MHIGRLDVRICMPVLACFMQTLVWLRNDLRILDNPALFHAANDVALVVYVFDTTHPWQMNARQTEWVCQSLMELHAALQPFGIPLWIDTGEPIAILMKLTKYVQARSIYWNKCYDPWNSSLDERLEREAAPIACRSFDAGLLFPPQHLYTKQGTTFKLFGPFWTHCLKQSYCEVPLPAPNFLWSTSRRLCNEQLFTRAPTFFSEHQALVGLLHTPGEQAGQVRLKQFVAQKAAHYAQQRDFLDRIGGSELSAYLRFGNLSARQVVHALNQMEANGSAFVRELGWREFSAYLLYHHPDLPTHSYQAVFERFPWSSNETLLAAWKEGKTGYPIVDAAMRDLYATGSMPNRARMVVASFLTKHLLIHWRAGAQWFWEQLLDADLAINTVNWQWVAGCGCDAAPYFRIFNPIIQSKKFDPHGLYIRRHLPALANIPDAWIHTPWLSPTAPIQEYPAPIVDHAKARSYALAAFASVKQ